MKPQLSPLAQFLKLAIAIALLSVSLLLACALWAPDNKDGISLWWGFADVACAVQGCLMIRGFLDGSDF